MWKRQGWDLKQAAVWEWLRSADIPPGNINVVSHLFRDIYPENNFQSQGLQPNFIEITFQKMSTLWGKYLQSQIAAPCMIHKL